MTRVVSSNFFISNDENLNKKWISYDKETWKHYNALTFSIFSKRKIFNAWNHNFVLHFFFSVTVKMQPAEKLTKMCTHFFISEFLFPHFNIHVHFYRFLYGLYFNSKMERWNQNEFFSSPKIKVKIHCFYENLNVSDKNDDENTESLKKLTSDKIYAATHHWYWVDTIVHVLVSIMIIVVATRMKLMNVANLRKCNKKGGKKIYYEKII